MLCIDFRERYVSPDDEDLSLMIAMVDTTNVREGQFDNKRTTITLTSMGSITEDAPEYNVGESHNQDQSVAQCGMP